MNKELFCKRVVELRKAKGYKSQEAFAEAYNKMFKATNEDGSGILGTIKNYENPNKKSVPSLEIVANICELLGCDIDYLTGRIEEKSHEVKNICEYTGLSEEAVATLHFINSPPEKMSEKAKLFNMKTLIMINTLLDSENYNVWLDSPFSDDNTPITVFTEMYDYLNIPESGIRYIGTDDGSIPRYYNKRDLLTEMCSAQIRKILDRINDKKQPG